MWKQKVEKSSSVNFRRIEKDIIFVFENTVDDISSETTNSGFLFTHHFHHVLGVFFLTGKVSSSVAVYTVTEGNWGKRKDFEIEQYNRMLKTRGNLLQWNRKKRELNKVNFQIEHNITSE